MKINKKTQVLLTILVIISAFILAYVAKRYPVPNMRILLLWSLLAILNYSIQIPLPDNTKLSAGISVTVITILLGGPLTSTIVTLFGIVFFVNINNGKTEHIFNTPLYRIAANISLAIIPTCVMGIIYEKLGGNFGQIAFLPALVMPIVGNLLNYTIVNLVLSSKDNEKFWDYWRYNGSDIFFVNIIQGIFGIIIAWISLSNEIIAIILFFVTLYLVRFLFKQHVSIMENYMSTIQIINRIVEAKDPYTYGHASRVQTIAVRLAKAAGCKPKVILNIERAALFHDIGKVGISDSILNKPGALTKEEYQEIKKHPGLGAEIISENAALKDMINIILYHHERYDGKGYPAELVGKEIPDEACIVSIADAYDAMTSDRPYRNAMSKEEAFREIAKNSGKQFNPIFVEIFLKMMRCSDNSDTDYTEE